ncbi:hypothetical protein ABPG73_008641 [Tetrahymena malaccensis]
MNIKFFEKSNKNFVFATLFCYIVIITCQLAQIPNNCDIGCQDCNQNFQCIQCLENFELSENTCVYKNCLEGLFFYNSGNFKSQNDDSCVAVCPQQYRQSLNQNTCNRIENCSLSYFSDQIFENSATNLKNLLAYENEKILIELSNRIVLVDRQNGEIQYQIPLSEQYMAIYYIQNYIFILFYDLSIFKWDLITRDLTKIYQIKTSSINYQNSINLNYIKNYVLASFIQKNNNSIEFQLIFTLPDFTLQKANSFSYSFQSNVYVQIFNSTIVQTNANGILIDEIKVGDKNEIEIQYFTFNQFKCSYKVQTKVLDVIQGAFSQIYYLILESDLNLFQIRSDECLTHLFKQYPLKLQTYQVNNEEFVVIQFQNNLSIMNEKMVILQELNFSSQNILQIIVIQMFESAQIIILLDNQIVQQLQISFNNQAIQLQQLNNISVIIDNAKQLKYLPAVTQQNILDRLLIVGDQIQSVILNNQTSNNINQIQERQQYVIQNYYFNYQQIQSQIKFTLILDEVNVMVNCAQEGIFIWDISHIYDPVYIFSLVDSNNQCQKMYFLSNYDILIVYQSSIAVFQIDKFYFKQIWKINNNSLGFIPKISVYQPFCAIIFNQNLFIYQLDQEQLIPYQFSNYTDQIQYISLQSNNYLIIQYQNYNSLYQLDIQKNQVNFISGYQTSDQIIKTKVRLYSNSIFEINMYLQNQIFIILDQNLKLVLQIKNIPLAQLYDFSFIQSDSNDDSYFLLGQTTQVSASNQFVGYCFFKSNPKLSQAWVAIDGIKILNVQKYNSNILQTFYIVTVLYNQPAYSAIIQVIYQPGQSKTIFNMKYMQYKYFQEKAYFANQKQNLISTDANGFIGVNQSLESMYTIFYSISSSELQIENNIIIDVIQNQFFGIIIVIKKFNILVFNSYTNQLIDNLQFGDSNASIVQYQLKQGEQPFIIACKANSLLIKSLDSQSQNTISDQQLNGFLVWQNNNQNFIITYGQSIKIYSFELDLIKTIPGLQTNQMIQNCKSSQDKLFCSLSGNQQIILIIDLPELNISISIKTQNTVIQNFILDDLNTVLFIYGQFIEYYQYNGVLINNISIYERVSLNLLKEFAFQQQGSILRYLIVEQYNHILVYIQSTQIYVYDIVQQTQITIIQSQSNYSQGNLYTGIVYDNEFYQLTTLSQSGNLYSISYQNFQSPQQLSKFIEFNPPQAPYAKGLNLDLTTNNCLLFSDQYVLQVDYSRLTNFFKQLQLNKNTLYSKVVLKEQNSLPYYVLAGQNNTLYTYNNFSVQYFGFVKNQNQIVDLQFIEQYQLLIIAFLQELRVYNITNVNVEMNYLIDDLPYSQELKFQINRFLTPSIFLTIDNQVVHYNFITMTVTQNIPLYSILSKFYINNSQTILILGLSNGDIIFYFLQNSNQLKFTLNLTKNKNSIKFIQETNSFIWIGSLNSYVIGFNKTNNQQQLNIYLNQYSNNNITTDLTVLEVDEENKRLFYNYLHQKVIYILDYTSPNSQIIKYMQFPGSQYNRIEITENIIILYSTFQFNLHNRKSLQYSLSIRRQNLVDAVNQIYIVQEQFYLFFSAYKYELFYVDFKNQEYHLLDQVQIQNYQIIDVVYNENENKINLITNIFQKQNNCTLIFQGAPHFQMMKQINSISPVVQKQPNLLGINTLQNINQTNLFYSQITNQDFSQISFEVMQNQQLVISPNDSNNHLLIKENLFQNYPLNKIQLTNFSFILQNNTIEFNQETKEVYLQNIQISNQTINNTQIMFFNLERVVIQNLLIKNMTINQTQQGISFLNFENCSVITIKNLTIMDLTFQSQNFSYFLSMKNVKVANIQNLNFTDSNFNNFLFLQQLEQANLDQIIVKNCKTTKIQTENINYFIDSQAIQNFLINKQFFISNNGILLLRYSNIFQQAQQNCQIQDDLITIQDSAIQSNIFTNNTYQLISIQAANIIIKEIFLQTQGEAQNKIDFFYDDFKHVKQSQYQGKLTIKNFKSGDAISIGVSIIDEEGNKFHINQQQLQNKRIYPSILNEISQYTFQLESLISENFCEACQYGTYSLQKFDNFNYTDYTNQNQLQQICKKCPQQANFCQGKTIQLQEGYWRESILEDETNLIQYCTNSPQNCQEQYHNQIKGCIDGYIGPLCETCDSLGEVWQQKYTKQFTSKFNCQLQMLLLEINVDTAYLQELLEGLFQLLLENLNKLPLNNSIYTKF